MAESTGFRRPSFPQSVAGNPFVPLYPLEITLRGKIQTFLAITDSISIFPPEAIFADVWAHCKNYLSSIDFVGTAFLVRWPAISIPLCSCVHLSIWESRNSLLLYFEAILPAAVPLAALIYNFHGNSKAKFRSFLCFLTTNYFNGWWCQISCTIYPKFAEIHTRSQRIVIVTVSSDIKVSLVKLKKTMTFFLQFS